MLLLSPHFDDAVLSCWWLLASTDAQMLVVNVFGKAPERGVIGDWDRRTAALRLDRRALGRVRRLATLMARGSGRHQAGANHEALRRSASGPVLLGFDSAKQIARRVAEDRRALALAGRRAVNLELLEAQYRAHPAYGLPEPSSQEVLTQLVCRVPAASALLLPAALGGSHDTQVGSHVDHRVVRDLWRAPDFTGPVLLYADVPYATRHGWPDWVADGAGSSVATSAWAKDLARAGIETGRLAPAVRLLSREQVARKRSTLRRYRTQWKALGCDYDKLRFEVLWRVSRPGEEPLPDWPFAMEGWACQST